MQKFLRKIARKIQPQSVAGIMVHGVFDLPLEEMSQWNPTGKHLHVSQLFSALEEICRDFKPIGLRELLVLQENGTWPKEPSFFLTFDDGYTGFEELILPLLKHFDCPASFFPVVDFVEGQMLWMDRVEAIILNNSNFPGPRNESMEEPETIQAWKNHLKSFPSSKRNQILKEKFSLELFDQKERPKQYKAVSWEELQRLHAHPLVTIGNHTMSHPILAREDTDTVDREIKEAAACLRVKLGSCDLFCYPNGTADDHDNRTRLRIEDSGHRCALLTHEERATPKIDPYLIPRFSLSANTFNTNYFRNGLWGLKDLKGKFKKDST